MSANEPSVGLHRVNRTTRDRKLWRNASLEMVGPAAPFVINITRVSHVLIHTNTVDEAVGSILMGEGNATTRGLVQTGLRACLLAQVDLIAIGIFAIRAILLVGVFAIGFSIIDAANSVLEARHVVLSLALCKAATFTITRGSCCFHHLRLPTRPQVDRRCMERCRRWNKDGCRDVGTISPN